MNPTWTSSLCVKVIECVFVQFFLFIFLLLISITFVSTWSRILFELFWTVNLGSINLLLTTTHMDYFLSRKHLTLLFKSSKMLFAVSNYRSDIFIFKWFSPESTCNLNLTTGNLCECGTLEESSHRVYVYNHYLSKQKIFFIATLSF